MNKGAVFSNWPSIFSFSSCDYHVWCNWCCLFEPCKVSSFIMSSLFLLIQFFFFRIWWLWSHCFSVCRQWLEDALKENDPTAVQLFLVGTKKDLSVCLCPVLKSTFLCLWLEPNSCLDECQQQPLLTGSNLRNVAPRFAPFFSSSVVLKVNWWTCRLFLDTTYHVQSVMGNKKHLCLFIYIYIPQIAEFLSLKQT